VGLDDTTILAEEKEDMEKLLKKLKEESKKAGLSLNLKKTKIMTTGTLNEFILDGTEIEITSYHTFRGSIITRDGYDNKEINRRPFNWKNGNNKTRKDYEGSGCKLPKLK